VIEKQNDLDQKWFDRYYQYSKFGNKDKPLHFDLKLWQRFTKKIINKQYKSEVPELLEGIIDSIQIHIKHTFKDIETNMTHDTEYYNIVLTQIAVTQASIECLLNLTNKSYELS